MTEGDTLIIWEVELVFHKNDVPGKDDEMLSDTFVPTQIVSSEKDRFNAGLGETVILKLYNLKNIIKHLKNI